jgi:SEC-C motif
MTLAQLPAPPPLDTFGAIEFLTLHTQMATSNTDTGIGDQLDDAASINDRCIDELRGLQAEIVRAHGRPYELFDFGYETTVDPQESIDVALRRLTGISIWHSIILKTEFRLKLLYTIDGYLQAVDAKNPVSSFLLARFLLELVATVSEIDFLLEECVSADVREWQPRAAIFLGTLNRARNSTSDEDFKMIFERVGAPKELLQPIRIGTAMKRLACRHGFEGAVTIYGMLSNMCHHNGSGHLMLTESFRATSSVTLPSGETVYLEENASALTLGYPATSFMSRSLLRTARVAWWSAVSANQLIKDLRETPFTDDELSSLTNGRLTAAMPYGVIASPLATTHHSNAAKVGRNAPCPCGSGKKYKNCCRGGR